jgi:hypothetical protein
MRVYKGKKVGAVAALGLCGLLLAGFRGQTDDMQRFDRIFGNPGPSEPGKVIRGLTVRERRGRLSGRFTVNSGSMAGSQCL